MRLLGETDLHLCLQLEDGVPSLADMPEDAGVAVVASHIRALTELRTEEERQVPAALPAAFAANHPLPDPKLDLSRVLQLASHMQLVQTLLADDTRYGLDVFEVAEGLRKLGHAVTIRNALGGGGGNECLRNLRHRFLSCRMQGVHCFSSLQVPYSSILCFSRLSSELACMGLQQADQLTWWFAGAHGPAMYIVDPCFKEQFEIPHISDRYTSILADVPVSFIGTEEQVIAVVEVMSKEISRAFQQANATLPPWRQTASMLSKWQPRKSEDLSLDAEVLDSRAPSLPVDLAPAQLRKFLGTNAHASHLQRHSTLDPFPALRPGGAHARVSLDETSGRKATASQKKSSASSHTPAVSPLFAQTAGVVATVQQSMSALGIRKGQGIPPASGRAVHIV